MKKLMKPIAFCGVGLPTTIPLMPRGSHLSCFAKKGDPKKATPTNKYLIASRRALRRRGCEHPGYDHALTSQPGKECMIDVYLLDLFFRH